jgi:hypothetical protein
LGFGAVPVKLFAARFVDDLGAGGAGEVLEAGQGGVGDFAAYEESAYVKIFEDGG